MKTKDFISKVERLGYCVIIGGLQCEYIAIMKNGSTHAGVDNRVTNVMDSDFSFTIPNELFDLLVEYSKTPIKERYEAKKYRLHLIGMEDEGIFYLNFDRVDKDIFFNDGDDVASNQTIFTEEEINNLPNQPLIKTLVWEEV